MYDYSSEEAEEREIPSNSIGSKSFYFLKKLEDQIKLDRSLNKTHKNNISTLKIEIDLLKAKNAKLTKELHHSGIKIIASWIFFTTLVLLKEFVV